MTVIDDMRRQPLTDDYLLSVHDVTVLEVTLELLKRFPGGQVSNDQDRTKLLAAVSYATGYMEATGLLRPEPLIKELIGESQPRSSLDGAGYDAGVAALEQLLSLARNTGTERLKLPTVEEAKKAARVVGKILIAVGTALSEWGSS